MANTTIQEVKDLIAKHEVGQLVKAEAAVLKKGLRSLIAEIEEAFESFDTPKSTNTPEVEGQPDQEPQNDQEPQA